jgi:chromate reductase
VSPTVGVRILAVSGSLRVASTNTAVLRTAVAVAPPDTTIEVYTGLGALPHFNQDDDVDPRPPAAEGLRAAVRAADALLLSTPEYAGALPGSFKNLLDWCIGDGERHSIYEKPVAWINASPRGATAAHESLAAVLGYAHATVIADACIAVPVTAATVGPDGTVADPAARAPIAGAVARLVAAVDDFRERR